VIYTLLWCYKLNEKKRKKRDFYPNKVVIYVIDISLQNKLLIYHNIILSYYIDIIKKKLFALVTYLFSILVIFLTFKYYKI
jgi:hypothetical protein